MSQIAAEKDKSQKLKLALDEEKILRVKAETSLHELRKVHEKMAVKGEMEEEKIVNKVQQKVYDNDTSFRRFANDFIFCNNRPQCSS